MLLSLYPGLTLYIGNFQGSNELQNSSGDSLSLYRVQKVVSPYQNPVPYPVAVLPSQLSTAPPIICPDSVSEIPFLTRSVRIYTRLYAALCVQYANTVNVTGLC